MFSPGLAEEYLTIIIIGAFIFVIIENIHLLDNDLSLQIFVYASAAIVIGSAIYICIYVAPFM